MSISPSYNILELIHDELHEHDKVPSESMLCDKFGISRLTVRQGINKLKSEGYLLTSSFKAPKFNINNILNF